MDDPDKFSEPDLSQLRGDPEPLSPGEIARSRSAGAASVPQSTHDRLMNLPGVVMVGEGLDERGKTAILVGVRTARDAKHVPDAIGGFRVLTEVVGDVHALPATPRRR